MSSPRLHLEQALLEAKVGGENIVEAFHVDHENINHDNPYPGTFTAFSKCIQSFDYVIAMNVIY